MARYRHEPATGCQHCDNAIIWNMDFAHTQEIVQPNVLRAVWHTEAIRRWRRVARARKYAQWHAAHAQRATDNLLRLVPELPLDIVRERTKAEAKLALLKLQGRSPR